MKVILGYFLFVLLTLLFKASSQHNCKNFKDQMLVYGVPQLCKIKDLCDVHCTCIHNAIYGKCIDYPTDNVYIPQPRPPQMCTCDYNNTRPHDMQELITRETCLLQYMPKYPKLFAPVCSVFCSDDCICAHGFLSGSCEGPFCVCNGKGPLNTPPN